MKQHLYKTIIKWDGNTGEGTRSYTSYSRNHLISAGNKPVIAASSDPAFRGDGERYNPEELFLASLSSCHMLWYLHYCADSGIIVVSYIDNAEGDMEESGSGGRFTQVRLKPVVTITDPSLKDVANSMHEKANRSCFIASSCNFPVVHFPVCKAEGE